MSNVTSTGATTRRSLLHVAALVLALTAVVMTSSVASGPADASASSGTQGSTWQGEERDGGDTEGSTWQGEERDGDDTDGSTWQGEQREYDYAAGDGAQGSTWQRGNA